MAEHDQLSQEDNSDSERQEEAVPAEIADMEIEEEEAAVKGTVLASDDTVPGFLETVYGVFFSPSKTFLGIARFPKVSWAVMFFLLVQLLSSVNAIAMIRAQVPDLLGTGFMSFFPLMMLTMALIGWFINASVLQLLAEMMGGAGRGRALFAALGFSYAPSLFSAPVSLFISPAFPKVANILTFLITVWVIILTVLAVRAVHNFTTGKAVWTVLIPFLGVVVLLLGFTILAFMVIIGLGLTEFPMIPGI